LFITVKSIVSIKTLSLMAHSDNYIMILCSTAVILTVAHMGHRWSTWNF